MAFFGTPTSFVGIDMGTSSLKIVELIQRRRRIEVGTYAEAQIANPLADGGSISDETVASLAKVLKQMLEKAEVSSDVAIAALPNSAVFSAVITLPQIADKEMEKAVQFAARDVVPADLNDMVLGWSRVGHRPHMATDNDQPEEEQSEETETGETIETTSDHVPVFITAAPKRVVTQYVEIMKQVGLRLHALEVETFPLVRSLLHDSLTPTIIVDIGDKTTAYHIIDGGTPRASHTIEFAGYDITQAIMVATDMKQAEAEQVKFTMGLNSGTQQEVKVAIEMAVQKQVEEYMRVQRLYSEKNRRKIAQTVLIGGGAALPGLRNFWEQSIGIPTIIGNPWKGLSYPQELETRLVEIGPTYGVAVGLAMRGFSSQ